MSLRFSNFFYMYLKYMYSCVETVQNPRWADIYRSIQYLPRLQKLRGPSSMETNTGRSTGYSCNTELFPIWDSIERKIIMTSCNSCEKKSHFHHHFLEFSNSFHRIWWRQNTLTPGNLRSLMESNSAYGKDRIAQTSLAHVSQKSWRCYVCRSQDLKRKDSLLTSLT